MYCVKNETFILIKRQIIEKLICNKFNKFFYKKQNENI